MKFFENFISLFSSEKSEQNKASQLEKSQGVLKQFNYSRGFGFIYSKEYDRRIFLHITDADERPKVGQKVVFHVEKNEKGLRATEVELASS